ncbi:MAG: MerR family transcriptional regulator, partial [Spirochaetota bacterium]
MTQEYGIGDFSIICRLTVKTLRYYQEEGLIEPSRVDRWTGYRYYDEEALDRARLVKTLRDWDFTIAEIRAALAAARSDEELRPQLEAKLMEIEARSKDLITKTAGLKTMLATMKEDDMKVSFEIVIKELPAYRAATTRVRGSYSDYGKIIGEVYQKFGRWMGGKP